MDALDTMLLMDLQDEFKVARKVHRAAAWYGAHWLLLQWVKESLSLQLDLVAPFHAAPCEPESDRCLLPYRSSSRPCVCSEDYSPLSNCNLCPPIDCF